MIIYYLYGRNPDYLRELERSLDSLAQFNPSDRVVRVYVEEGYELLERLDVIAEERGLELRFMPMGDAARYNVWWPKILVLEALQGLDDNDEVLVLDTDTIIKDSVEGLFALLDRCDLMAPIGANGSCKGLPHLKGKCPEHLPYHNTGTLCGRVWAMKALYGQVRRCVEGELTTSPHFPDEYAFNLLCHTGSWDFLSLAPSQQARNRADYRESGPGKTVVWHNRGLPGAGGEYTWNMLGHMIRAYDAVLRPLAPGVRGLEIGTFEGQSLRWMMRNLEVEKIYCVDPFKGEMTKPGNGPDSGGGSGVLKFDGERALGVWRRGAAEWGTKVELLMGTLADFDRYIRDRGLLNFVIVDGDHSSQWVLRDCVRAWDLLDGGGIMLFDDAWWDSVVCVIDSFVELLGAEVIEDYGIIPGSNVRAIRKGM